MVAMRRVLAQLLEHGGGLLAAGGTSQDIHERGGLSAKHWADIRARVNNSFFSKKSSYSSLDDASELEIKAAICNYARYVEAGRFPNHSFHHRKHLGQEAWRIIYKLYSGKHTLKHQFVIFGGVRFSNLGDVKLYAALESSLDDNNDNWPQISHFIFREKYAPIPNLEDRLFIIHHFRLAYMHHFGGYPRVDVGTTISTIPPPTPNDIGNGDKTIVMNNGIGIRYPFNIGDKKYDYELPNIPRHKYEWRS